MSSLIKAVKDRPMLWDKSLESYKDREERKRAWIEIFRLLDENYDRLPNKRDISDGIISKWTNVRDAFLRAIKKSQSNKQIRKYVHYDEMAFLLKIVPQQSIPCDLESDEDTMASSETPNFKLEVDVEEETSPSSASTASNLKCKVLEAVDVDGLVPSSTSAASNYSQKELIRSKQFERKRAFYETSPEPERRSRKQSRKSKRLSDFDETQPVDFVDTDHDPRIMNEDEAFFASLLPTVVNYSEDERLEFRIDVLAVMKNISQKRRINRLTDDCDD